MRPESKQAEVSPPKTIVLRQCIQCRAYLDFGVWPWTGRSFTVTHGLCRSCLEELDTAAAAGG